MSIDEAFQELINDPYLWNKTKYTQSYRAYLVHESKHRNRISEKFKRKCLTLSGFLVIQEEKWGYTDGVSFQN